MVENANSTTATVRTHGNHEIEDPNALDVNATPSPGSTEGSQVPVIIITSAGYGAHDNRIYKRFVQRHKTLGDGPACGGLQSGRSPLTRIPASLENAALLKA